MPGEDGPLAPENAGHKYQTDSGDSEPTPDVVDEASGHEARVDNVRVSVTFHRPENRTRRYTVHVDDSEGFGKVASYANRAHRLAESNQWEHDGRVDWADLPVRVRRAVADAIAGVDDRADLAPGFRFIDDDEEAGGRNV